jgi:hypothetical protein
MLNFAVNVNGGNMREKSILDSESMRYECFSCHEIFDLEGYREHLEKGNHGIHGWIILRKLPR